MSVETQTPILMCDGLCRGPTRHAYVQTTEARHFELAGLNLVNHRGPVAWVHWFECQECMRRRIWGVDNAEG